MSFLKQSLLVSFNQRHVHYVAIVESKYRTNEQLNKGDTWCFEVTSGSITLTLVGSDIWYLYICQTHNLLECQKTV